MIEGSRTAGDLRDNIRILIALLNEQGPLHCTIHTSVQISTHVFAYFDLYTPKGARQIKLNIYPTRPIGICILRIHIALLHAFFVAPCDSASTSLWQYLVH